MTLLGKIFTVMIFIMSVLFMAFSVMVYATHKNWRDLVIEPDTGLKALNEKQDNVITALRADLDAGKLQLARERAARRAALAVLETKASQQAQLLTQKQAELDAITIENGLALQQLKAAQDQLAAITTDIVSLRLELIDVKTKRDGEFAKVSVLTDQIHDLQGDKRNLEERRDQLISDLARYKQALDVRGISVDTPADNITPDVQGIVTAVANADFFEISIGSDDGLLPGHELIVFRDRTYLGKVIVRKTTPNRSVVQMIKDTSRGQVKGGDRVAAKLS